MNRLLIFLVVAAAAASLVSCALHLAGREALVVDPLGHLSFEHPQTNSAPAR